MLSVAILTYNRSELLRVTFRAIKDALCKLEDIAHEIIISDDASTRDHQAEIDRLAADKVLVPNKNGGLSRNHNRAIAACRYPFILSLQDDWEYVGPPHLLLHAIEILSSDEDVGVVNFLPPPIAIPHVRRELAGGARYLVFQNDGGKRARPASERPYSDRPHIKRAAFARDIGPYNERLPMTRAEIEYQRRVAGQPRWKVAYIENEGMFNHLGGEASFNPGHLRQKRIERLQAIRIVGPIYSALRSVAKRLLRRGS